MADFEDHVGASAGISLEIERKLVALGVDWQDESALRQVAGEVLQYDASTTVEGVDKGGDRKLVFMELCGLIGLMNTTLAESATDGQQAHGRDSWKALAKALWAAKGSA
ncbi:hypothetical protein VVD49_04905 [Uliginosibacterium sp. H3]|uniref:NTP pyrophosphohydrolase MazG putative catalytic core domain-containing protein n=1 Tax=Uliginosibacterium silvisoli TaxID=3114758 RepID=A0ABU6K1Y4_9RHOO|nr:hypothetical protein [Uliginosibacterium sp. H3]